MNKQGQ